MTNIVIITRDRPRLIHQTLESIYANTPHDQFNLVVVDDGSLDFKTQRIVQMPLMQHSSNYSLLHVSNSGHTLSQLKNLGVAWAEQRWGRGDWLCIADNDCYFMDGWLKKVEFVACRPYPFGFQIWGGQAHPFHLPVSPAYKFVDRPVGMIEHDCLAGTHWFMPWSTWDTFGPFDRTTAPGVCQSEDYAFTQRIRAAGGRIGVTVPHCCLDCGITNSDGKPSPGADLKLANRVAGVYYE